MQIKLHTVLSHAVYSPGLSELAFGRIEETQDWIASGADSAGEGKGEAMHGWGGGAKIERMLPY